MSEFDFAENKPSVTKARVKKLIFESDPNNADICYEVGYMDGDDFIKLEERWVHIQNYDAVYDENEQLITPAITDFTDMVNAINTGDNINQTLKQVLKVKLGVV